MQDDFLFDTPYEATALKNDRRKLALNLAMQIYSRFGWNDPPEAELEKAQQEKFGFPAHS